MRRHTILALVAVLGLSTVASAQHAGFVLFGKSNAEAAKAAENSRFVHPVTSPYFHEDSFVTSDVRAWFLYHNFPNSGTINGGDARVYAVQARLALTDTLQLVAYKDGYTEFNAGLFQESGWNDVAAGLKWNFIQDWANQFHMAAGVGYEFPFGDSKVLHNDGEIRAWVSVNKGFGPWHFGATFNYFYATSRDEALGHSDYISYHLHADYYLCKWFSPVVELNGFHACNKNDQAVGFSGIDVTNLGGGADVVTLGLGGEFRVLPNLSLRGAYEMPLTDGEDLYGWRVTFSAVLSF